MKNPAHHWLYWLPGAPCMYRTADRFRTAADVRAMILAAWFPDARRLPAGVEVYPDRNRP